MTNLRNINEIPVEDSKLINAHIGENSQLLLLWSYEGWPLKISNSIVGVTKTHIFKVENYNTQKIKILDIKTVQHKKNNMFRWDNIILNLHNGNTSSISIYHSNACKHICAHVNSYRAEEKVDDIMPILDGKRLQHGDHYHLKVETYISCKKLIKGKSIPKVSRYVIWIRDHGDKASGLCKCCNTTPITFGNFECGHVVSRHNGGSIDIKNLRSICGLCNKSMGIKNMDEFISENGF